MTESTQSSKPLKRTPSQRQRLRVGRGPTKVTGTIVLVVKVVLLLALKALAGGTLVTVFAFISDAFRPRFLLAGLFSAAPAVALSSLLVTSLLSGRQAAAIGARGMIAGAVGFVVYAALAAFLVQRLGALWGSTVSWVAWAAVAFGLYAVLTG
ncbi:MAG: DUF3147 family protein [Chloroflexi bacterium]|nr:MAG: DUF3147 family protein [Chloroflexota bacterium]TME14254.1 MAG: DUF3147 family protein [Chloroflexota bacterium]TME18674.1 MAG: DUF3147 family protein [Chloroflexota bacterium]